jgi:hypothetical protein
MSFADAEEGVTLSEEICRFKYKMLSKQFQGKIYSTGTGTSQCSVCVGKQNSCFEALLRNRSIFVLLLQLVEISAKSLKRLYPHIGTVYEKVKHFLDFIKFSCC